MVGAARRGKQQQRVISHAGIPSAPTIDRHVLTSQFKVHLTRDGVWLMKLIVLILPLSQLSLELPCRYPNRCGEFCMTVFHCSGFIARILNPRQHEHTTHLHLAEGCMSQILSKMSSWIYFKLVNLETGQSKYTLKKS